MMPFSYGKPSVASKVPSASMLPAIWPGDHFISDKRVGQPGGLKVRRGDIAVFRYPNDRTTMYVKRIIGLPGDTVAIEGTSVKVNGVELRQGPVGGDLGDAGPKQALEGLTAVREIADGRSYTVLWGEAGQGPPLSVTVPNGHVFVLGDNRSASRDSRHFGVLPLADVTALAKQVWLSYGAEGLRGHRLGRLLD